MSAAVREIVANVWTEHIGVDPDWTPQQTEAFFDEESRRLSVRINAMAAEQAMVNVAAWKTEHGRDPDYLTHVGLINNARLQVQEIVLSQELYELVPSEEEDTEEYQAAAQAAHEERIAAQREAARSDPERWRGPYCSLSTEETDARVAEALPDRTSEFQSWASFLWQQRVEDGLPLPVAPGALARVGNSEGEASNAALISELTAMVEDDRCNPPRASR